MNSKLKIFGIVTSSNEDLRSWVPESYNDFSTYVLVYIGTKKGKGADIFTILAASPLGLAGLVPKDGILYDRPLVVLEKYDDQILRRWIQKKVKECQRNSWEESLLQLRKTFRWEFEFEANSKFSP